MISKKTNDGYFLVLKRGEKLIKTLTDFCTKNKIKAASLAGIGAVEGATVGYYYLKQKRYKFKKLNRLLEIVSLSGNVSLNDKKFFLHLHVVLSDGKLRTYGGHLKEAQVGGTCEVYLKKLDVSLERKSDKETGLNLIN